MIRTSALKELRNILNIYDGPHLKNMINVRRGPKYVSTFIPWNISGSHYRFKAVLFLTVNLHRLSNLSSAT